MSPMLQRFLKQLDARGLSVGPGAEPGQLLLHGPAREKTPAIIEALRAFKPDLVKLYAVPQGDREAVEPPVAGPEEGDAGTRCRTCRATLYTTSPEEIARVCDRSQCPHKRRA